MFKLLGDRFGKPYFSWDLEGTSSVNVSELHIDGARDVVSFFNPHLKITRRASSSFSRDLTTDRDDVILAFLSLILLLIIEGFVTTLLLRTRNGNVSNFGFSVKYVLELFRDLNVPRVFRKRTPEGSRSRKPNFTLIAVAIAVLSITVGVEVAVLFLTSPQAKEVTNETATFRTMQPVTPEWEAVFFHNRASVNRPCQAIALRFVDQVNTRINACVSSSLSGTNMELFEKAEGDIDAVITSHLHQYGAEHEISIGSSSAKFSARAYFTLASDNQARMMSVAATSPNEEEQICIVHKQYIAYLFSIYLRVTEDKSVDLDTLNSFNVPCVRDKGRMIDVLPQRRGKHKFESRAYTTSVTGVLPRGPPALNLAQHVFRGAIAVIVSDADSRDLFVEDGVKTETRTVWKEQVRVINWLSLLIIIGSSTLLLFILRYAMRPVAIADIAGVFVKNAVGADLGRSPVEVVDTEKSHFRVTPSADEDDYAFGAEIGGRSRFVIEYSSDDE